MRCTQGLKKSRFDRDDRILEPRDSSLPVTLRKAWPSRGHPFRNGFSQFPEIALRTSLANYEVVLFSSMTSPSLQTYSGIDSPSGVFPVQSRLFLDRRQCFCSAHRFLHGSLLLLCLS